MSSKSHAISRIHANLLQKIYDLVRRHGCDLLEALGKITPKLWSLTHSRWFCGVATVRAIDVSVLSGRCLADEGFFVITGAVVPLEIGILSPHLDTVLFKVSIVWLT